LKYSEERQVKNLIDIILPAAQLEGTSALLSKWLVALGDTVSKGTPIIELETDKVAMEICAPETGVLSEIIAKEGEDVMVDTVLGLIDATSINSAQHSENERSSSTKSDENDKSDNIVTTEQVAAQVVDIILPAAQLEGTSATLAKWLVAMGDTVSQGDAIIELETDKVSMEISAPISGALSAIMANEGDVVLVDTVLGQISSHGDTTSGTAITNEHGANKRTATLPVAAGSGDTGAEALVEANVQQTSSRHLIGPAVRRLLKTHGLDIERITGTGRKGRVTRDDVLAYLASPVASQPQQSVTPVANNLAGVMPYTLNEIVPRPPEGTMVPHTTMRKAIANHMVKSLLETSPHVTSVFEMDMSNIIEHRKWHKKEFAEQGVNLTFTAYFLAGVVQAAQAVPQVNARFHDDALELFSDINIGVGTALGDKGLVVPVVQQVQSMSLFAIARALNVQTEKARTGKLTPSDMKHGTFTISNHGVSGSLLATPIIINQPQVAILGVGKLEKRVVVEDVAGVDTMVIRPKCYVSLSIDHRALDAHQTNLFLAKFVAVLESWGQ
jgi:2-oxoglutarate dehydrogenase E2 component (dihydrolipoamide succinyltransferase)